MNEIKARYFSAMAAEIERYGGKVEKNIGDAIMAVFGRVRAREDDAIRGVQAAAGMVDALHGLNEEFAKFYGVQLDGPDRRQHRRGRREHRRARDDEPRDRRRGQRRRPARAERAGERGPDRRGHVRAGPRLRRGRARRADAQGQGRAGARVPAAWRPRHDRGDGPPGLAVHRPRVRDGHPERRVRRVGRRSAEPGSSRSSATPASARPG